MGSCCTYSILQFCISAGKEVQIHVDSVLLQTALIPSFDNEKVIMIKRALAMSVLTVLVAGGVLSMFAVPARADTPGDINFWLTNTGSAIAGGLDTNFAATGTAISTASGSTTFTFAASGYSYTKIAAGTDNFILAIMGGSSGTVCLDITLTATTHGTDSGTSCSGVAGDGLYTFIIPSTWGGLVTSGQSNTFTITCDTITTAPGGCTAISLQWGGNSSSSSNVQIPSAVSSSVPEFGMSSAFVAAFALLGAALLRRGKINWTP